MCIASDKNPFGINSQLLVFLLPSLSFFLDAFLPHETQVEWELPTFVDGYS